MRGDAPARCRLMREIRLWHSLTISAPADLVTAPADVVQGYYSLNRRFAFTMPNSPTRSIRPYRSDGPPEQRCGVWRRSPRPKPVATA